MITQYLQALQHEVTEVRILRSQRYLQSQNGQRSDFTGDTISGYYTAEAYEKLEADIQRFDTDPGTKGIYTTLHACNPSLHARAANRLRLNAQDTTSDHEIKAFSCFPIDIDPQRPSGISASDAELELTADKAKDICTFYESLEVPFVKAASGNGYHVLVFVNPSTCDEDTLSRWKATGDLVAERFETDTTIYNPARIWKLYGTNARKGDNTKARPHRRTQIWLPDEIQRIDFDDLQAKLLAELFSTNLTTYTPERSHQAINTHRTSSTPGISLREWLDQHGVQYTQKPYKDGTKYQIDCPFNPAHTSPDAVCYESAQGWAFKCSHNSCASYAWHDFKAKIGAPPRESRDKKRTLIVDTEEVYADADIDRDTTEFDDIVFPKELFTGLFKDYRDAMIDKNPVPDAFLFATLKQAISASLGRAVFIQSRPVIYPIHFTGLIGDSSTGHKGVALKLIRDLLRKSDPNVLQMPALSTEEGFIDMFVDPDKIYADTEDGKDKFEGYRGGFYDLIKNEKRTDAILETKLSHESIRILGCFDEFSQLLMRSKKTHNAGMIEMLMQLFDAPHEFISPNKHSKAHAKFPTFGMIGCSAFNLIENALDTNYIGGGLTNRVEWYHGEEKALMFLFDEPDIDCWTKTVEALRSLRETFQTPTAFTLLSDANAAGMQWMEEFHEQIQQLDHDFVVDSLKRQKMLILKNALIFAVLRQDTHNKITQEDVEKAIVLSEYTCNVVNQLFSQFHNSESKRVVNRIIEILKRKPKRSKRQIWNDMKWAETKEVEESIDRLWRMDILGMEKPKRTPLYFVLKSEI